MGLLSLVISAVDARIIEIAANMSLLQVARVCVRRGAICGHAVDRSRVEEVEEANHVEGDVRRVHNTRLQGHQPGVEVIAEIDRGLIA